VKGCQLCPLSKSRLHAVPGEGPDRAELMIVGEGPGREEDLQGRPFVGRAGKLLTSALEEAGFRREEIFITNVVKCRPPENRTPTEDERDICTSTYLVRQIELIKPKFILLLGNTAVQTILGEKSVSKVRGKVIQADENNYFCTYHPAAVLYDVTLKEIFAQDVKMLKQILLNPDRYLRRGRQTSLEKFA